MSVLAGALRSPAGGRCRCCQPGATLARAAGHHSSSPQPPRGPPLLAAGRNRPRGISPSPVLRLGRVAADGTARRRRSVPGGAACLSAVSPGRTSRQGRSVRQRSSSSISSVGAAVWGDGSGASPMGDGSGREVVPWRPSTGLEGSVTELVAAWDQIWSRLPAQSGAGANAHIILGALKMLLAIDPRINEDLAADSAEAEDLASVSPVRRALEVALILADLCATGLPLDADAIAVGILADAYCSRAVLHEDVEKRLGEGVAQLLHDVNRVRGAPKRVDLSDDNAASGIRELCLSFYDVRAIVIETTARLERMRLVGRLPVYAQQLQALECLQVFAPMGHAVGVGKMAGKLEDICFKILFPKSYEETSKWLQMRSAAGEDLLDTCREQLQSALASNPEFTALTGDIVLRGRTKSLFSTMKKLLRMEQPEKGGRTLNEVHDLMGIRAIVYPREGEGRPAEAAEADAVKACYIIQQVTHELWGEITARSKDYIGSPKPNGYQSLHSTVVVDEQEGRRPQTIELQIRTLAMEQAAEQGGAAHAAYKGGLDSGQAQQLKRWTEHLLTSRGHTAKQLEDSTTSDLAILSPGSGAKELFRQLDLDGDGLISSSEVENLLMDLGGDTYESVDEDGVMTLSAGAKSGDQDITLEDFMRFRSQVAVLHGLPHMDRDCAAELSEATDVTADEPPTRLTPPRRPGPSHALPDMAPSAEPSAAGGFGRGFGRRFRVGAVRVEAHIEADEEDPDISPSRYRPSIPQSDWPEERYVGEAPRANGRDQHELVGEDTEDSDHSMFDHPAYPRGPIMKKRGPRGIPQHKRFALVPLAQYKIGHDMLTAQISWNNGDDVIHGIPVPVVGPVVIGAVASKGCDCIIDEDQVSGRHARIEFVPDKSATTIRVTDLESTNGTFLNGARLRVFSEVDAHEGDVVSFGGADFAVLCLPPPEPQTGLVEPDAERPQSSAITAALRCAAEVMEAEKRLQVEVRPSAIRSQHSEVAQFSGRGSKPNAGVQLLDRQALRALLAELRKQGRLGVARQTLAMHAQHRPEDGTIWSQWASLEASSGSADLRVGAIRAFYRAAVEALMAEYDEDWERLGSNPNLVMALCSWGLHEFSLDNKTSARRLLRKSVDEAAEHPDGVAGGDGLRTLHRWASAEREHGKLFQAKSLIKEGLEHEPTNPQMWLLKGKMFVDSGKTHAAREAFNEGLRTNPRSVQLLHAWAVMEGNLKDIDGARALFREAVEIEPDNHVTLQAWAVAEARCGYPSRSRTIFQRAVAKSPENDLLWQAWGRMELGRGDIEKARKLYQQALRLDPTSLYGLCALANLEQQFGDLDVAKGLLEAAMEIDEENAVVLQEMGYVMMKRNKRAEGKAFFKKAEQLNREAEKQLGRRPYQPVRFNPTQRYNKTWWKKNTVKTLEEKQMRKSHVEG